jgi:hypothetical protein
LKTFDDVAWKTAQTTGTLAYMPYNDAKMYANIYAGQAELYTVQERVIDDTIGAGALIAPYPHDWQPSVAQVDGMIERIGLIRMRLLLLGSSVDALDKTYQEFESGHS